MTEDEDDRPTAAGAPLVPDFPGLGKLHGGAALGRYVVLDMLGEGGMGQVYRGYDPKLRREVAIKVLGDKRGDAAIDRLVREAQAMAQLNHPNVVSVYDVEEQDGRIFLAMELVEGQTLSSWLEQDHPVAETLALLMQAGRGLAAAHDSGLIHRDFKPSNVMVGADGRARVVDFGIARGSMDRDSQADDPTGESTGASERSHDSLSAPLTHAGVVMGTPAYMAPEQHGGHEVDHRVDQYAFCTTVYQAIAKTRPFRGRGEDLLQAKVEQKPPPLDGVPKHVQAAIAKGLSADPKDRFASMPALLSELERRPGSGKRRLAVLGALGLTLAGGWGWQRWSQAQRAAACLEASAAIDEVWNDGARESVTTGIEASGLAYAPTTAASTLGWLDEHASRWSKAKNSACLRADVEDTWDEQTLARSDWCLGVRRAEFEALIERLDAAETIDVETAVQRAAGLASVEPCVDDRLLGGLELPPPQARDELSKSQQKLSQATALIGSWKVDEALGLARGALAEAESLASGPMTARAHLVIAEALDARGEFAEGAAARKLGYFAALEAGASHIAGAAATGLVFSTGVNLAREEEANDWYRHAEIHLRMAGVGDDELELANAEMNIATVDFHAAKVSQATPRFHKVLAVTESTLGESHPQVAQVLNMLASSIARSGKFADARPLYDRAIAIQRTAYGDDHPAVATTLHNIATGLHVQGEFRQAAALYEQSLEIRERSLRPDHPDIGLSLNNLAGIAWELGDKRKSLDVSKRALKIWESQYGPGHPRVANSLTGVAGTHVALGEVGQALPLLQRAAAIYDEHPRGAKSNEPTARFEFAKALAATGGDLANAREQAEKARDLFASLGEAGADNVAKVQAFLDEHGEEDAGGH